MDNIFLLNFYRKINFNVDLKKEIEMLTSASFFLECQPTGAEEAAGESDGTDDQSDQQLVHQRAQAHPAAHARDRAAATADGHGPGSGRLPRHGTRREGARRRRHAPARRRGRARPVMRLHLHPLSHMYIPPHEDDDDDDQDDVANGVQHTKRD